MQDRKNQNKGMMMAITSDAAIAHVHPNQASTASNTSETLSEIDAAIQTIAQSTFDQTAGYETQRKLSLPTSVAPKAPLQHQNDLSQYSNAQSDSPLSPRSMQRCSSMHAQAMRAVRSDCSDKNEEFRGRSQSLTEKSTRSSSFRMTAYCEEVPESYSILNPRDNTFYRPTNSSIKLRFQSGNPKDGVDFRADIKITLNIQDKEAKNMPVNASCRKLIDELFSTMRKNKEKMTEDLLSQTGTSEVICQKIEAAPKPAANKKVTITEDKQLKVPKDVKRTSSSLFKRRWNSAPLPKSSAKVEAEPDAALSPIGRNENRFLQRIFDKIEKHFFDIPELYKSHPQTEQFLFAMQALDAEKSLKDKLAVLQELVSNCEEGGTKRDISFFLTTLIKGYVKRHRVIPYAIAQDSTVFKTLEPNQKEQIKCMKQLYKQMDPSRQELLTRILRHLAEYSKTNNSMSTTATAMTWSHVLFEQPHEIVANPNAQCSVALFLKACINQTCKKPEWLTS